MKTNININANEWCEMVFEGKNHEYGAYAIRTESATQQVKGLFIAVSLAITIAAIPLLSKKIMPPAVTPTNDGTYVIHTYDLPPADLPKVQLPEPPKQPMKSMIKFTTPIIVPKNSETDMASQEVLQTTQASIGKWNLFGDPNAPANTEDFQELYEEKETIHLIVDKPPQFTELQEYLRSNLRYPTLARELGISGTVVLQFVVNKKGEIQNIKVLRSVKGGCDDEAIRVIKSMPKWHPGIEKNEFVSVLFTLPIRFMLNE